MKDFGLEEMNQLKSQGASPKELSPLVLAYIGDGVFEMLVRTMVVAQANAPVNTLHKKARRYVNAKSQSAFYFSIKELLNDEEQAVFKRGRNAKSFTVPKNADLTDYRHATGLEALFGYLYLSGSMDRLLLLYNAGINNLK